MRYGGRWVWPLKLCLIMLQIKEKRDSDKPDLNVIASKTTSAISNRRARKIEYLTDANDQMLTPLMSL